MGMVFRKYPGPRATYACHIHPFNNIELYRIIWPGLHKRYFPHQGVQCKKGAGSQSFQSGQGDEQAIPDPARSSKL